MLHFLNTLRRISAALERKLTMNLVLVEHIEVLKYNEEIVKDG